MSILIKTPDEIEKMRVACKLAAEVLEMIVPHVVAGVNTEELDQIYTLLDELEPVEKDKQYFRPRSELFHWPLALALVLTCLAGIVGSRASS